MANILPRDLPPSGSVPSGAALIVDNGVTVEKATPSQLVDSGRPNANQTEAVAGTDNTKGMTPLRTRQAIMALSPLIAGNVAETLQDLKDYPVNKFMVLYDQANFTWTPGDYTGQADDVNIIASDNEPLSEGAWVRQSTETISYKLDADDAVVRTPQAKLDEIVSVADFLGVLSSRGAFQKALDTGRHVRLPGGGLSIDGPVTTTAAGQVISGDGAESVLTVTGTNANANAIIIAHDDCTVSDVTIIPNTTVSNLSEGWGITVSNVNRAVIRGVRVSGMRRGGIRLVNANNCLIEGNIFTDSVVTQNPADPEPQSDMGYDILLNGTSSYNIIRGNECVSGTGVGIGLQTIVASSTQYGNIIEGNIVKGQPCYGIMLYGTFALPDNAPIHGTVVANNRIEDISGTVFVADPPNSYFYGAGIYAASSINTVITGNNIKGTNTDETLPWLSGTPAAISVTGYGSSVVSSNVIEDCYDGIWVTQTNEPTAVASRCIVTNNRINGCRRSGMRILGAVSVRVAGNSFVGTGVNIGIYINASGVATDRIDLESNFISGFNNGIETTGAIAFLRLAKNTLRNNVDYGVYSTATIIDFTHNYVAMNNGATAAIRYTVDATSGICSENIMTGNTTGLIANSTAVVQSNNTFNGVLNYTGSVTWDPGSLADGAGETSAAITVTGAAIGDFVMAAAPYDLQGITCSAYVSAANTVRIRLQNETGAVVDLASGLWRVRVMKAVV
ncbi:right-handed parallel beta-helix repeat-containing protein [Sphingomonas cannabina]|uniref:right-handed parallel beta-helix repeat-containing protein n=1 Tax=Sphingomonas cannabina TaxID=2899123 RepID=UPI001F466BA9|nr:right-handed parallel beta-helix repeat-containing protein [Sphingomonas cannabina]UIJ43802.1 right-handed parallel beta-helix repeat-containing protein [Sphingomonas cannabina]